MIKPFALALFIFAMPAPINAESFQLCIRNFFSEGVRTNHDMARKLLSYSVSDLTNMQINCYKGDYRQPPMTKTNLMNATRMSLEMHEMAEMSLTLPEREFQ